MYNAPPLCYATQADERMMTMTDDLTHPPITFPQLLYAIAYSAAFGACLGFALGWACAL